MSKKLMSVILVAVLVLSMGTVAMASVSADELPAKADGYNRYYFYLPESWLNEHATTAGIYWWEGTDACSAWPGYTANPTDVEGVYYYDVHQDVTTIIWNNAIDGGTDPEAAIYTAAYQTKNIGSEYYDAGESANYPDGTPNFDEMIYVIDESKTDVNEFSGKSTFAGEWYYYYGNGEYGFTPEKGATYFNQRSYMEAPTPVPGDVEDTTDETISYVGETVTYVATLTTPKNIENVQATTTYTADTLKLVDATVAERFPNMTGVVANAADGAIYFNASEISTGFDFTGGKTLIALTFEVIADGEMKVETAIEEMVEFFGPDYVTGGEIVADGVVIADELVLPEIVVPTTTVEPTTVVDPTKAPETDVQGTTGGTSTEKPDVPPTGANVALFAAIAVVAMAAAAVVVLRKKVNA
ncbi:MAG: hypothetical protein IKK10_02070 [Clostridia bacterium]|nr:hypothetical protein [Clostridia bacterium]